MSHDPYLPTINFPGGMSINITAEQLAEGFWSLPSDEMADFFAALERLAGWRLCLQMASVVSVMTERAGQPEYDHDALHGFQTMLSHAQGYHESAAFFRAEDAKRDIAAMVRGIKKELRITS